MSPPTGALGVLVVVAEVAGVPVEALGSETCVIADLCFDSLSIAELVFGLVELEAVPSSLVEVLESLPWASVTVGDLQHLCYPDS